MNPADFRRQVYEESETTGIRKKLTQERAKVPHQDTIDMGLALENLKKVQGWFYLEAYIYKNANPVALLMSNADDPEARGKAKGLILLMQWIDQTIDAAHQLLDKENEIRENAKAE